MLKNPKKKKSPMIRLYVCGNDSTLTMPTAVSF